MITLFGYPHADAEGEPIHFKRRKSLALIAYLAVHERPQPREWLAGLLWPYLLDKAAAQNLRNLLVDIRGTAVGDFLTAEGDTLTLDSDLKVDVRRFSACIRDADPANLTAREISGRHVTLLAEAVALYGGSFLMGLRLGDSPEFDDWQYIQSEHYQNDFINAAAMLAEYYVFNQRADDAEAIIHRWLAMDPAAEPAHRLLMQLYMDQHKPDQALHQYHTLERLLRRQDNTQPQSETARLYERIRSRPTRSAANKTITSLLPGEPLQLVARDDDLAALKPRLSAGAAPVIVCGEMGVGKSALAAVLAYAPDVRTRFRDGVLWATLGPTPDLDGLLRLWMSALEVSNLKASHSLEHRAMHLAAALVDRHVLLVLDDVWSSFDTQVFTLAKRSSAVLMTTRFPALAQQLAITPERVYALAPLSDDAGRQILLKRAPALVNTYPKEAGTLVRHYRSNPLLLTVVAQVFHQRSGDQPTQAGVQALYDARVLLDYPILSDQFISREPLSLRRMMDTIWQPLPAAMRERFTEIIEGYNVQMGLTLPQVLTLFGVEQTGTLDHLLNNGLLIEMGESLHLNPLLIAYVQTLDERS